MKVFRFGRSYLSTEIYKVEADTVEEAEKILEKTSDPCSYYEKTINTDYVDYGYGSFDYIDEHEVKNDWLFSTKK